MTFGVVFFDRLAVGFLAPFLVDELRLTRFQLGMLNSAVAMGASIAAFLLSSAAHRITSLKRVLVIAVVVFSVTSAFSALALGFVSLLLARLALGFSEGPALLIAQSVMAHESSPVRRGINLGVVSQLGTGVIGAFLGPLVLVQIASHAGWRAAFWATLAPGLLCAALVGTIMRRSSPAARMAAAEVSMEPSRSLWTRNIVLCMVVASIQVGVSILSFAFTPLYLMSVRGYSAGEMSTLMALMGFSQAIFGFLLPGISDRLGRRRVLTSGALLGICLPIALLMRHEPTWLLALGMFLAGSISGNTVMAISVVPSETLPRFQTVAAIALVAGTAELVGGVAFPSLGGLLADHLGLSAICYLQIIGGIVTACAAVLLKETAPRILAR